MLATSWSQHLAVFPFTCGNNGRSGGYGLRTSQDPLTLHFVPFVALCCVYLRLELSQAPRGFCKRTSPSHFTSFRSRFARLPGRRFEHTDTGSREYTLVGLGASDLQHSTGVEPITATAKGYSIGHHRGLV